MKLQVRVKVQGAQGEALQGKDAQHTLELVVGPQDTVRGLKERICAIEPMPFPEQDLLLDGGVLGDDSRFADCAVKDGSSLELLVRATEETLAQQLGELLQARAVPPEELGLLYSLRHGVPVRGALQALGRNEQLHDFLKRHDCFVVDNGLVTYLSKAAGGKPAQGAGILDKIPEDKPCDNEVAFPVHVSVVLKSPAASEETSCLDLKARSTETVLGLKDRISAAELIPFRDRKLFHTGGELHDTQRLMDCGLKGGSSLDFVAMASEEAFAQQLSQLLQARALSINELSLLYSCRHGATTSRVLKVLGRGERLPGFLGRLPQFTVEGGCVRLEAKARPAASPDPAHRNQRYLDLHGEICNDAFMQKAAAVLGRVAAAVSSGGCLNVRRAVRGGSVGRGTAVPGAEDAEVVLFLDGLPHTGRERWLPGLVGATAATLQAQLSKADGIEAVSAAAGSVQVSCEDNFTVSILFSPVFASHREVIDSLGAHPYSAVALAEQRVGFVARQPEHVRMATRLLKWWSGRQPWSSSRTRPSDALLELATVYVAMQTGSCDLSSAVEGVLELLSDFDNACIVWPDGVACYGKVEVPQALLRQRPLLLDPVNPLVNLADPTAFDAQEMTTFAKSAGLL